MLDLSQTDLNLIRVLTSFFLLTFLATACIHANILYSHKHRLTLETESLISTSYPLTRCELCILIKRKHMKLFSVSGLRWRVSPSPTLHWCPISPKNVPSFHCVTQKIDSLLDNNPNQSALSACLTPSAPGFYKAAGRNVPPSFSHGGSKNMKQLTVKKGAFG